MAVSTVDEYLSALKKSKLLGSEQLVEAQRLAGESSDAAALAKTLAREKLLSRWQAGTLLALGQRAQLRLGKYKLIQRLGKGGMGTVFLAEHVTMNRRVALKIVPRTIAENRASLDRFFAEARAIAALDHPNIVRAYSVDNEMDRYFIVMEFVDGQDLQRTVELNGPLEFDQAADYIRQATEGLAHAHAHNLVHCDIKPSNLLVNNQGVIKILDLGLARLNRSDEPRGAAAGEPAFGTVDYMAPEQALETTNFDHRADIYSLGCTLYFLLTGHPPFPEGTLAQRIVKHQTQEPRDLQLERPGTSPKLVEICKRMMAKEPEKRYQSIQEVGAALAPWQRGANGATSARAPQAVKPLDDDLAETVPAGDWLSSLSVSPKSTATANGVKTPAATAVKPTKSVKQKKNADKSSAGTAAALVGVSTGLGWFNTTKRKVLAAVGGAVLLVVAAGLGSLLFLRSHPKPEPQTVSQTTVEVKKTVEAVVDPTPDNPAAKKAHASKDQDSSDDEEPEVPRKKVKKHGPPKSDENKKPEHKPANKPDAPKEPVAVANAVPNPAQPVPKPDLPVRPAEVVKSASLDGLESAVDLPPTQGKGANEVVSLGKLDLDPKLLKLKLLGGKTVAKGNPEFELKPDDSAPLNWSVQMTAKNKDAVKIAKVWQEENEWKIKWTDAKDKATLLRYCGLQFSLEKTPHFIALSKPKTVPPLLIDFDKFKIEKAGKAVVAMERVHLPGEFTLPDPSVLKLQILKLDPSLPKNEIKKLDAKPHPNRPPRNKPAEPEAVPALGDTVPVKGLVIIAFTKEKTPSVTFTIEFKANGKDVLLEIQETCDILGQTNMPFNGASLQTSLYTATEFARLSDPKQNRSAHPITQPALDKLNATRDEWKALVAFATDLNRKSWVPFRVYAVLGEGEGAHDLVIFDGGKVEKPKPPGTKKETQGKKPSGDKPKGDKSKGPDTPERDETDVK